MTAAHVIQGIESKEHFDGKILLRVNFRDGNSHAIETDINEWLFHPEETEVDVAVLPHIRDSFLRIADVKRLPVEMFLNEAIIAQEDITLGDEVFLTGLFYNHSGRAKNIPIVRVGNIAAMPEEKVLTKRGFIDAYLVEARSIGGLSGSPVFVHLGTDRKIEKGAILVGTGERGSTYYLLGLMQGHYKIDLTSEDEADLDAKTKAEINMGIAIVVPSGKILEVIGQPMIKEREEKVEAQLLAQLMPTENSSPEQQDSGITQEGFMDALKHASRKISSPDEEKGEA